MLTIHRPGGPSPPERKTTRPRTGATGFHLPIATEPQTAAPEIAADVAPAAIDGPGQASAIAGTRMEAADHAARTHAGEMLDVLGRIQRDMLGADRDPAMFHRLAALADAVPEAASPGLRQAMRAVATRAKVELARDQMAALGSQVTAA